MNSYFVGQRVRVVGAYGKYAKPLIGKTGRIVGPLISGARINGDRYAGVPVQIDGWDSPYFPDLVHEGRLVRYAPRLAFLEPVVDDGMQPARWEDCAWRPEKVHG